MVGVLAFIVYGLYPDTKEVPTIPDSGQGNKIQTYDQLLGLGQDINGNGQPAWREIVFGGASTSTDNSTTSNLTIGLARDITVLSSMLTKDQNMDPEIYVSALADNAKKTLTIRDVGQINISSDTSRTTLKAYGNTAGLVFGALFGYEQKEVQDVSKYIASGDSKDLSYIKKLQSELAPMCDKFKNYPVPKNAATLHRSLIEKCYYYNDILLAFLGTGEDPTKSMMALNLYEEMLSQELSLFKDFADFFTDNNIIFGPSDYGYIFNKKI